MADYFNTNLADLIQAGKVVIMQYGIGRAGCGPLGLQKGAITWNA